MYEVIKFGGGKSKADSLDVLLSGKIERPESEKRNIDS